VKRGLIGLTLALHLLQAQPAAANPVVIDVIHERAAAHGQSGSYLTAVARCESRLDPYAVGALGEKGLFQLASFGLLPTFYAWGYSNPWSAWEQSDFAARAFARGMSYHWSCAR
jgi:hypothetical protein